MRILIVILGVAIGIGGYSQGVHMEIFPTCLIDNPRNEFLFAIWIHYYLVAFVPCGVWWMFQ